MEENLEKEKKVRGDVEKTKRKIEADLKMAQEAIQESKHVRHDMEEVARK